MPLTPLHYPVAYAMRKLAKRAGIELDMAGLAIGSFTPDLECPFFMVALWAGLLPPDAPWAWARRLVLHSLLGSLTLGSLISILIVLALYRLMAPEGMDRPSLPRLYVACALGNLSHVLLDAVHHPYNPLFYPFTAENVSALVLMGDLWLANLVVYGIVVPASVVVLLREWGSEHGLLAQLLFDPPRGGPGSGRTP